MKSLYPDGPSLRQIQEAMAALILGPCSASADRADAKLCGWLYAPSPAHAGVRLGVYANGYPARVHDALADTYPALARLVGEAAFQALAQRYAASVPLTSYNLNDAGAQMGALLEGDALSRARPFLADLAALEWRVALAFHAAERPPLDPTTLPWSVDDWANAVLHFQPSVALLSSAWPLLDLWSGTDTPAQAPQAYGGLQHIVVRRAGFVVRCELVTAGEAAALRLLLDGCALGESMDRLDSEGHDPAAVSEWCARWMGAGMVAGARLSSAHADCADRSA